MLESLRKEIAQLDTIQAIAVALVEYAIALVPDNHIEAKGSRFVLSPENFATFTIHSARANNLTVSLRGNPEEFEHQSELEIVKDQNGYSSFKLKQTGQLAAASIYIRRTHELYSRGRGRPVLKPKTVES